MDEMQLLQMEKQAVTMLATENVDKTSFSYIITPFFLIDSVIFCFHLFSFVSMHKFLKYTKAT